MNDLLPCSLKICIIYWYGENGFSVDLLKYQIESFGIWCWKGQRMTGALKDKLSRFLYFCHNPQNPCLGDIRGPPLRNTDSININMVVCVPDVLKTPRLYFNIWIVILTVWTLFRIDIFLDVFVYWYCYNQLNFFWNFYCSFRDLNVMSVLSAICFQFLFIARRVCLSFRVNAQLSYLFR